VNKLLKLVAIALTAVAFAGCAQLPRSSEVKAGPEIQGDIANDYLYYSPSGPVQGETQQEILSGFLNAGTGPQNDYEAARLYLTQDLKTKWNPNAEVLIQQGSPTISFNANQQAAVTVQVQATVDGDGHYVLEEAGATRLLEFDMVREAGEWRISRAPNLTLLIRPVFDVIFRSYSIYFFDAERTHLVPDLRWFPSRASTATRMMNAMLKGPSDWLEPAVNSAIPAGTALSLTSVTVADGIASVDLTAKALTAKDEARRQMKAQIRATLTQLPNVYSVAISVERGPQEIVDIPELVPTVASNQAVVLTMGELQVINGNSLTPIGGTADLISRTAANDFAITESGDWVALRGASGTYRSRIGLFGTAPTITDARAGQLTPMFDDRNYLWTMTKKAGEAVQITAPGGSRNFLSLGWLDSFPRRQFALSAEGSRIALLVGSGQNVRTFVASVIRDQAGLPVAFGTPLEVVGANASPISVSWSDENTIAVLHSLGDGTVAPTLHTIGGTVRELGLILAGRSLEARANASAIFTIDANRVLYGYRNITWSRMFDDVQAIHFAN
jgi:hypothetical protein